MPLDLLRVSRNLWLIRIVAPPWGGRQLNDGSPIFGWKFRPPLTMPCIGASRESRK